MLLLLHNVYTGLGSERRALCMLGKHCQLSYTPSPNYSFSNEFVHF